MYGDYDKIDDNDYIRNKFVKGPRNIVSRYIDFHMMINGFVPKLMLMRKSCDVTDAVKTFRKSINTGRDGALIPIKIYKINQASFGVLTECFDDVCDVTRFPYCTGIRASCSLMAPEVAQLMNFFVRYSVHFGYLTSEWQISDRACTLPVLQLRVVLPLLRLQLLRHGSHEFAVVAAVRVDALQYVHQLR